MYQVLFSRNCPGIIHKILYLVRAKRKLNDTLVRAQTPRHIAATQQGIDSFSFCISLLFHFDALKNTSSHNAGQLIYSFLFASHIIIRITYAIHLKKAYKIMTFLERIWFVLLLGFVFPKRETRTLYGRSSRFASSFTMQPTTISSPGLLLRSQKMEKERRGRFQLPSALANDQATKKKSRFGRFGRGNRKERTDGANRKDSNTVQINFIGTEHVATKPIKAPEDSSLLDEYFSIDQYQTLLFPENNATYMDKTISHEVFATWCKQAELGGASGPSVEAVKNGVTGEEILELHNTNTEKVHIMMITAYLQMPALLVRSESVIGVKLIRTESYQSRDYFPEIQFTLLDSQLILEGSKAAQWIFNQLMKYKDSTSSFTRVTAERSGDDEIVFTTNARLQVGIQIPSAVLKLLPAVNVEKFEKQGSESIQKLLEKDLEPALNSFCDGFNTYVTERVNNQLTVLLKP